jgi:hypothetical protein
MLEVQKYLCAEGNSFETLTADLGIGVTFHPTHPLVKLNYDMINSTKGDARVRECRGLVLHKDTLDVVGSCFHRFFNLGEMEEITGKFEWMDFSTYEKVDGSWIQIFYNAFEGKWNAATRGSWADQPILPNAPVWSDLVFELLGSTENLDTGCTYLMELCTGYNKVVRAYPEPTLYLLGIVTNETYEEWTPEAVDFIAEKNGYARPIKYEFKSLDELKLFLQTQERIDPTFEGCVVQDCNGLRIKIKSLTYVSLHQLKGNNNLFLNKNLLPFILAGETTEATTYFPECLPRVEILTAEISTLYTTMWDVWEASKYIESQKEFAQYIMPKTPLSPLLFKVRRSGGTNGELENEFRNSFDLLVKLVKDC